MATTQKSILIVEDEEDIREVLRLALELEGYVVHTAANGIVGLDLLKTIPKPCVILLDLMMPVMNGWQFIENLQQNEVLMVIPVVVVTAFNDKTRPINAQTVLKKPVDLNVLLKTIEQFCA